MSTTGYREAAFAIALVKSQKSRCTVTTLANYRESKYNVKLLNLNYKSVFNDVRIYQLQR